MFELKTETTVHLRKFSKREEVHGKDLIPAIDLALSYKAPAAVLGMLHPQLREALFMNTGPKSEELDLAIDDTPNVRAPIMETPIGLDYEQTGCSLRVHYGTSEKSHVVLALVKAHKFKVHERVEGGMVELHFTLSCANEIDADVIGKLGILGGHDIAVTLDGPVIEDKDDAPWPFPNESPKDTRQTPAQALAAQLGVEAD